MPNQHLLQRLSGVRKVLLGVHAASGAMSSATRGQERQVFVDTFLAQAFPLPNRIGSGDATDVAGHRSGQLDIVIEHPIIPSVPLAGTGSRLYLAEGIAAVVEVKSNATSQWPEVIHTATQLSALQRSFGATSSYGPGPTADVPFFVAAYSGWNQMATVESKLSSSPAIDGVLIIDSGLFASSPRFGGVRATGDLALWGLVCCVHQATNSLISAATNPLAYAV